MKQVHNGIKLLLLTMIFYIAVTSGSHSAEIKGVHFDDHIEINGVELQLIGVAVLTWAMFFDVYAGGLYLPEEVSVAQWIEDVPKKLELSYFRNIEAKEFADSSDKLLRENLSPQEYETISSRLKTFYTFFEDVSPGDRYSVVYIPGKGTELRLNNETKGGVSGHDFARAYFGIWLGDNPIKQKFRDGLLGTWGNV